MRLEKWFIYCMAMVVLSACFNSNNENLAKVQLSEVKSDQQFKDGFAQPYLTISEVRYDICHECIDFSDESTSSHAVPNHSGTNLQVTGVDESDIWKYDGENFFVLAPSQWEYQEPSVEECQNESSTQCSGFYEQTSGSIRIVKNTQETLSTIDVGEQSGSEIYVSNNQLTLIYKGRNYYGARDGARDGAARIRTWDVADLRSPSEILDVHIDGNIQRTRRIENELYIVSQFTPRIENLNYHPTSTQEVDANQTILDSIDVDELLPSITINGEQQTLVSTSDCLMANIPTDFNYSYGITTITRFNTRTHTFNSRCVAGPIDGIYMTQDNLYLYDHSFYEFEQQEDDSILWTWADGNTHIHQFALDSGAFNYRGSALLPGLSGGGDANFRYGELSDGSLAVVTSTNEWQDPEHRLTILKSNGSRLNVISQLPNENRPHAIGKPGERIYSVRFMQDRAYIVTFQNFDPLYAIDLSNTLDPKIAGELEIPGFSEYLHPVGDDLLIGIGKSAVTDESGRVWIQGIKVSLFDVSDMHNPLEADTLEIGMRGSHTALSYDYHAFTGIQVDNQYRFAFPISVNDGEPQGNYYPWVHSGLHLFEVTNNQLSFQGAMITHRNEGTENWDNWDIRRGLIQGNEIYHLSGQDIFQANWINPNYVSEAF